MAQSLVGRGLNTVELPLLKLSMPTQSALPFNINANEVEWHHYTDQPVDRLTLRIETFRPYQATTDESQALEQSPASTRTCKLSVWSGKNRYYVLDVMEYTKQWNHTKVKEKILNVKHKDNGILIKALSPLSQLNHSMLSPSSSDQQLFCRVQVRCTNTTDAQKVADTLSEFCPGIDGGLMKNKQMELTQSLSKTQIGSTPRSDQSMLLTESQMGGHLDWQGSDRLGAQQRYTHEESLDQDGFRKPPPPSHMRERETSRMDAENDLDRYQRPTLEGSRSTNYHHRDRSAQPSLDLYSPISLNRSEAPAQQPYTPALSLRGGPEPDRYQYPRMHQDDSFRRNVVIAPSTHHMDDVLMTPTRKRNYEEYPESYTQAETITPIRFPLHPNSSPRAPPRQLQDLDSPLSKRIKTRQNLPPAESYENQAYAFDDRPLIDMDAPSIRMPPARVQREEDRCSHTRIRPGQEEGGQTRQTPRQGRETVFAQIQTTTGLYALAAEELEDVVNQVLAEDGFTEFVKSLQSLWQARVVAAST